MTAPIATKVLDETEPHLRSQTCSKLGREGMFFTLNKDVLSVFLFNTALEVLTSATGQKKKINGMQIGEEEIKPSAHR